MSSVPTIRSALRAATTASHDRVDALYSRIDLADMPSYGRFLMAQGQAQLATESALTEAGAAAVLDDWPERQRAAHLCADLTALALPIPEADASIRFDCPAAVLGGVYVLEGSRLGGALLRRRVPAHFPAAFLGAPDPAGWRRLIAVLEQRLSDELERERAIVAAIAVFALFESSGRQHLR